MSSRAIEIQSRADEKFVAAAVLSGMAPADLLVIEGEWRSERSLIMQQLLAAGVPRTEWPQSLHWDWSKKAPMLQLLASAGYGVVCENRWQGVMLTESSPRHIARLAPDQGKPLVYIEFLEIAPWNWRIPKLSQEGQFRAIGARLFWQAVEQSEDEGFHGRVGLHSLRQAEPFYENACKMTPLGRDANKEDLMYFELSREEARKLLESGAE